jgi:chaperone modulatory protein CbpM
MDARLSLDDLARACRVEHAVLVEWVELGVVHAEGASQAEWRFASDELARARDVARLARDLDLAPYAAALVADLVAERARLERRVRLLERLLGPP